MKLQSSQIPQNLTNRKQNNTINTPSKVAFTGIGVGVAQFLRFLDTNQAWGASGVDITCMDAPRTAVDFTRGPDAGIETMRREFSSTGNNMLTGSYGLLAAWCLAQAGMNREFSGVKAHKMFVSDEMLDIFGQAWDEKRTSAEPLNEYLTHIMSEVKAFNPDMDGADVKGYVAIDETSRSEVVKKFKTEIENNQSGSISKETKEYLKSLIADSTGTESKFKLEKQIGGKTRTSISSLDDFIDGVAKVSKTFMNEKVAQTFSHGAFADNKFINRLKGLNKYTALFGLATAGAVGLSLQPLNMYLTRRKTGKTGFVGVEGREPDKSSIFKLLKYGIAGLAGLGVIASIGKPSELLSKIQFKGLTPTISQYKFVYGATIVSRLLSSRDKNELRETSIKDSLGFANWLILGGFVSKLVAAGFEKMDIFKNDKFIRHNEVENGKSPFNWLIKSSIVTRDEVLHTALKKAGISTVNEKTGIAMTFKKMMELAPKSAKTKIKYLNMIQLSGYVYSGLVLGFGIPKLNIAITKHFEGKRKMAEKAEKQA